MAWCVPFEAADKGHVVALIDDHGVDAGTPVGELVGGRAHDLVDDALAVLAQIDKAASCRPV